jgi:hypothetical protein
MIYKILDTNDSDIPEWLHNTMPLGKYSCQMDCGRSSSGDIRCVLVINIDDPALNTLFLLRWGHMPNILN